MSWPSDAEGAESTPPVMMDSLHTTCHYRGKVTCPGGQMTGILSLAKDIATPLSLAALALLILFGLYRTIFDRLKLDKVIGKDVYRLLRRAMAYVFVVALATIILGVAAHVIPAIIDRVSNRSALEKYVGQLESVSLPERSFAISGLEEVGVADAGSATRVCDVLSSFVRTASKKSLLSPDGQIPDDVQRAIVVISRLLSHDRCLQIDLSESDLRRLQLPNGGLPTANLTGANLEEANLSNANLSRARLVGARLTSAVLRQAILKETVLNQVNWRDVDLRSADLSHATGLQGADLRSVSADNVNFGGVDLRGARFPFQMKGATFDGANLENTDLTQVRGLCESAIKRAAKLTTQRPEKYDC